MSQFFIGGRGSNIKPKCPIVYVPKCLWRGGVRREWDNVPHFCFVFLKASLSSSTSSSDESCGMKYVPVFSSKKKPLTPSAGKKLSKKLKKTHRASLLEASKQKQKIISNYLAPTANESFDNGRL